MINLILPQARSIHARRNSVATCLSCYSKLFGGGNSFAYDLAEPGQFYRDYETLMEHGKALLPTTHFLELTYEDVVSDIEGQARRMLEFLDLPGDPVCPAFHKTALSVRTASVNQVRQPIYWTSTSRRRKHAANLGPLLQQLSISEEARADHSLP